MIAFSLSFFIRIAILGIYIKAIRIFPIGEVFQGLELTAERMELIRKGHANSRVAPMEGMERSMRLSCVSRLLAMMNTGDQLWVCKLSDLADNAEDACTLYFSFLKKGIELKFFDTSYLDTDLLRLNSEPPADQKLLIQRIIQNYFDNPGGMPSGTKERSSDSGSADSVKKNLIVREARSETIAMLKSCRHEASLMEAFLRESVISIRTYKRYFQKHSDPNLFLNTKLPPVQKSDQSEAV